MKLTVNNDKSYTVTDSDGLTVLGKIPAASFNRKTGFIEIFSNYYIHISVGLKKYLEYYEKQNKYSTSACGKKVKSPTDEELIKLFKKNDNVKTDIQAVTFPNGKIEYIRGLSASKNLQEGVVIAVYPGILQSHERFTETKTGVSPEAYLHNLNLIEADNEEPDVIDGRFTQTQANLINHMDSPANLDRPPKSKKNVKDPLINVWLNEKVVKDPKTNICVPVAYYTTIKPIFVGMPIITDYGVNYEFQQKGEVCLFNKILAAQVLSALKEKLLKNKQNNSQKLPLVEIINSYYKRCNLEFNQSLRISNSPLLIANMLHLMQERNQNNIILANKLLSYLFYLSKQANNLDPIYNFAAYILKDKEPVYFKFIVFYIVRCLYNPSTKKLFFNQYRESFQRALDICDIEDEKVLKLNYYIDSAVIFWHNKWSQKKQEHLKSTEKKDMPSKNIGQKRKLEEKDDSNPHPRKKPKLNL